MNPSNNQNVDRSQNFPRYNPPEYLNFHPIIQYPYPYYSYSIMPYYYNQMNIYPPTNYFPQPYHQSMNEPNCVRLPSIIFLFF